jgi:poly-gamma-glutamate synthesis protein (capsule biosynthesis protein)
MIAGRNLAEARRPAIIAKNGLKVAFLAYCSVMREGYEATADRAGVAPLRASSRYEPMDYQPGVPPRVITTLNEEDLAAMVVDIRAAKKIADAVVLSLHWGIHLIPRLIADYQPAAARAAFDAGADVILGHHAHAPKAIGMHDGKVCFYSLSNFIMSAPPKNPAKAAAFERNYHVTMDPDYPHLPYGADGKRSLIAKVELTKRGAERVSFLPVLIDKQLRPEVLHGSDPRFDDAVNFMNWLSKGYDAALVPEGDEVRVNAA